MSLLKCDHANGVVTLTLNQPEKLNLLSEEMLVALQSAFDEIKDDPAVRLVILRAEGKAFCAGHNLKEMNAARSRPDGGLSYYRDLFSRCSVLMKTIVKLPQPVIAQVQGVATAAGCQLVASCDLAVAARSARFGVNGVNIGLFCSTPMVALTRNIGRKRAFEMLTTGEMLSANEALDCGLVNQVAADGELAGVTIKLTEKITSKSPAALKIGKRAFYAQAEMTLDDAYDYAAQVMAENMMEQQTIEGISGFLNKK